MGDNRTASPSLTAANNSASSATAGTTGEKGKKRRPPLQFYHLRGGCGSIGGKGCVIENIRIIDSRKRNIYAVNI